MRRLLPALLVPSLLACAPGAPGGEADAACEIGFEPDGHAFVTLSQGGTAPARYGTQGSLMMVLAVRSRQLVVGETTTVRWTVDRSDPGPPIEGSARKRVTRDVDGVPHVDDLFVIVELVGPAYVPDPATVISVDLELDTPSGPVQQHVDVHLDIDGTPYSAHPS